MATISWSICPDVPELPEVETIVRDLAPRITGRTIVTVDVLAPLVVRTAIDGLAGRRIGEVRRHGKFILFECDGGVLVVHLGMTGKLLVDGETTPYTRVVFGLDEGRLLYDDVRQFGRVEWHRLPPARLARLGPDPLSMDRATFVERLRRRNSRIKPLLLNQRFLRGLGNIYTDEALFRAGIHPLAVAARLSRARAMALHDAICEVLREAIALRGSSISDYVDAAGARGGFQLRHRVYGKEGEPCPACGGAIERIVVGQRGTHLCPRCQRR